MKIKAKTQTILKLNEALDLMIIKSLFQTDGLKLKEMTSLN